MVIFFGSHRTRDNIHFRYTHGFKMPHFTRCMLHIYIYILLTRRDILVVNVSQRHSAAAMATSLLNLKRVCYTVDVHFGSLNDCS